jgi:hypothetical protein
MRKLLDRFKARRVRRQELSLQRWEQQRAKGQGRFVLQQALTWAVMMTSSRDVYEHLFDAHGEKITLWFYFIFHSLVGILAGFMGWSRQEAAYKDAVLNRRLQTPFDDRIKPR